MAARRRGGFADVVHPARARHAREKRCTVGYWEVRRQRAGTPEGWRRVED